MIIHTRPHDGQRSFTGGERVKLQANYFRLLRQPTWNIYKYHVTFEPECMMARLRNALIMQHKSTIGGFLFDGTQIFVTRSLEGDKGIVTLTSKTHKDEVYTLKLHFTKVVQMDEQESLQILNLILRRATQGLKLNLVGRNYYDANSKVIVLRTVIQKNTFSAEQTGQIFSDFFYNFSNRFNWVNSKLNCGLDLQHPFASMNVTSC